MFHSDWDNFDQLVSNVYGAGSVHTAVGIYMQDLGFCEGDDAQKSLQRKSKSNQDIQPKKKQRSFKSPVQELAPCYHFKRSDQKEADSDLIWVIARQVNSEDQVIPGISGWVSVTGQAPKCTITIGYHPMVNAPIADLRTIQ